jgi:hypothetical protein
MLGTALTIDSAVALIALIVSILSFAYSFYFWRRSFRPIVTAAVKTDAGGNVVITYNLVVLNSGTIPAKNVRLSVDPDSLARALGQDANDENRKTELACFDSECAIAIIHNNDRVSCSFGDTGASDTGFWKYGSKLAIIIRYQGWFGKKYEQAQEIQIVDSESFTGYMWG